MRTPGYLIVLFMVMFLTATTASAFFIRYDGPYEGKIVDADTGDPIEGVVVLGVWNKETPNVAGSSSTFYDAKETVTDKNGEFKIQGLGLKVFSFVGKMNLLIFKAGYEYFGYTPWISLKIDRIFIERIKWKGEKAIIPLRKLTMAERKKNMPPLPPGEAPYEKIRLMLDEYNKNSKELGTGIIDIWRDKR